MPIVATSAHSDAPVSGGVKNAADGTLAIMVGGEAEPVTRKAHPRSDG